MFEYDAQQNRYKKDNFIIENNLLSRIKTEKHDVNYYIRDAQGNVLAIYSKQHNRTINTETGSLSQQSYQLTQKEQHLYGSSRLGILQLERPMASMAFHASDLVTQNQGTRNYELTNHLGNVLSTITDKGVITSAQDYYPFGLTLASRSFTEGGSVYRYSFNGKEDDKETGFQDYGMRMYFKNLGRFPIVDPITKDYPELTPYQFASNTPIQAIDLDGLQQGTTTARSVPVVPVIRRQIGSRTYRPETDPAQRGVPISPPQRDINRGAVSPVLVYDNNGKAVGIDRIDNHSIPSTGEMRSSNTRPDSEQRNKMTILASQSVSKSQDKEDEGNLFEYFYRAMTMKEYSNLGGNLGHRVNSKGELKGEGPFVTTNKNYLTNDESFIHDQPAKYEILVTFKVKLGTLAELTQKSLVHPQDNITKNAIKLDLPIMKLERNTINFSFPGQSANTYFNPQIVETKVEPIKH